MWSAEVVLKWNVGHILASIRSNSGPQVHTGLGGLVASSLADLRLKPDQCECTFLGVDAG